MNNSLLQKLLYKIAVKRFMDNFSSRLNELDITNSELSIKAGKAENALSKTLNQMEDPSLSSFLRYWNSALNIITVNQNRKADILNFDVLLDDEIKKILDTARETASSDLKNISNSQKNFLLGLKVYVEILKQKNAVTQEEYDAYLNIIKG